jgi:type II secretory pathway component GspD/PulD (secretin)
MKAPAVLALSLAAALAWPQAVIDPPAVTISGEGPLRMVSLKARGADVRQVLFDLFDQAGESFMLDPGIKMDLFLSLQDVEFEEALALIMKTARLESVRQNGITVIRLAPSAEPRPEPAAPVTEAEKPAEPAPVEPPKPKPSFYQLTDKDLEKPRITLVQRGMPLREVFKEFTRQTQIEIDIMGDVPNYLVDVNIQNKTLLQAMMDLCKAANLKFTKSPIRSLYVMRQEAEELR